MDADRKLLVFEKWYKPMYGKYSPLIFNLFDMDNIVTKGKNRRWIEAKSSTVKLDVIDEVDDEKRKKIINFLDDNKNLFKKFQPFRLSGDADFQVYVNKEKISVMHKFPNFSLIPVTGGLNCIKGIKTLSEFLKILEKYFGTRKYADLPYRSLGPKFKDENKQSEKEELEKETLKSFFDIFDNIDDYCKNMYFLEYKDITEDYYAYWKKRIDLYKGIENSNEKLLFEDMDQDKYK